MGTTCVVQGVIQIYVTNKGERGTKDPRSGKEGKGVQEMHFTIDYLGGAWPTLFLETAMSMF
jgi:hypothetical protein|uniref:Uncharacterized protein n=1 Tax=Picea glauca TaxID=3330 RepID=A0A101LW68_PICGL|nr:hypothetical protein ABT39_MTgene1590 [Picea glauca]